MPEELQNYLLVDPAAYLAALELVESGVPAIVVMQTVLDIAHANSENDK